jgi:hypothetical protein
MHRCYYTPAGRVVWMRETTVLGLSLLYNRVKHASAVFAFFLLPFMAIAMAGVLIVIKIIL